MSIRGGNGEEVIAFKNGGFGSNNPSEEACYDIIHKHGGASRNIGPFISIRTGSIPLKMFPERKGGFQHLRNTMANWKTAMQLPARTANAHESMIKISNFDGIEHFPYYRFGGGERLGKVGLAEWESHRRDNRPGGKTLAEIEDATSSYLRDSDVQRDLNAVAKILVERRRLRTRDMSKWDRSASYSYYQCDLGRCGDEMINTAQEFKEHIRKEHRNIRDDQALEAELIRKRRVHWLYRPKSQDLQTTIQA